MYSTHRNIRTIVLNTFMLSFWRSKSFVPILFECLKKSSVTFCLTFRVSEQQVWNDMKQSKWQQNCNVIPYTVLIKVIPSKITVTTTYTHKYLQFWPPASISTESHPIQKMFWRLCAKVRQPSLITRGRPSHHVFSLCTCAASHLSLGFGVLRMLSVSSISGPLSLGLYISRLS